MNNSGAVKCFTCPQSYYCDGTSPKEFVECPVAHYCPNGTTAYIPECPAGEGATV